MASIYVPWLVTCESQGLSTHPAIIQCILIQCTVEQRLRRHCDFCFRQILKHQKMDASRRPTDFLDLPHKVDSTGMQSTRVIAVNKSLQVWQLSGDPETASDHEDILTAVHADTLPVRSAEQHRGMDRLPAPGMVQELSSHSSTRLDKEIQEILWLV